MKGFYKGKYLIAIYDKNDMLVDVVCLPKELSKYKNPEIAKQYISNVFNGRLPGTNIYFIDVTEKHDDIFAEEDNLFLVEEEFYRKKSINETLSKLGISKSKYQKYKTILKFEK